MSQIDRETLVFFHTAPALVEVFDTLAKKYTPTLKIRHRLRDDLLASAVAQGAVTPEILNDAKLALNGEVADDVVAIICTCSTIGEAVDGLGTINTTPVFRIDRPMAVKALESGNSIRVLATLETTIGPTVRLLEGEAQLRNLSPHITSYVIPKARDLLMSGNRQEYLSLIVDELRHSEAITDVIVLAQASMAEALEHISQINVPVLSSPEIGFRDILVSLSLGNSNHESS